MIPDKGAPRVVELRDGDQVRNVLEDMRVSSPGVDIMERKALFRSVLVRGLDVRAANILKQEMLSRGGEVATSREVYEMGGRRADCLLMGTLAQYEQLFPKLRAQSFGLRGLADSLAAVLEYYDTHLPAAHPGLDLQGKPLIMGIVNVTPDSFSDPGDLFDQDVAIREARRMTQEGAAILDVGGESNRPGSDRTPLDEELRRVLPVVEALSEDAGVLISVDTYKADVASRALEAGATMVNDISALRMDPGLIPVVRDANCPVILMHMLGEPRTMQDNPVYEDVVEEIYQFFLERLNTAVDAGVAEENLLIDPGIGFGKTREHNLELIRNLSAFRSLGRPVVLGASRKRFIGGVLGLSEAKDRVVGTAAVSVLAGLQEVDILRVHDVRENVQAVRMMRAVYPPRRK